MKKNVLFWSEAETIALKKFYPHYPSKITRDDLLQLFPNRTWNGIVSQVRQLGLSSAEGEVNMEFAKQLEKVVKI